MGLPEIGAMVFGWFACFSGVALGGFLVFRTRRDSAESLFQLKEPKGQAFNLPDGFESDDDEKSLDEKVPNVMKKAMDFEHLFAEKSHAA